MDAEFYRSLLTDEDALLYELLLDGLLRRAKAIRILPSAPLVVNRAMSCVLKDHPELAWTIGKWSGHPGKTSIVIPEYTLDAAEIRCFQEEMSAMEEALRSISQLPAAQRVKWVFDFVLENVAYDLSAAHSQDAYGALVEGSAVCRGIAKGMQLMLRACGLEAITLEGRLCEGAVHVWNVVSLPDGCFHLDLTMGYPMFSALYTRRGLPWSRYAAFCVSDETLCQTHIWDSASVPLHCP